ncbi:MAG TPA: DUF2892 domain-containing protein [Segetibacter sp.]|jgi:hypothetical protein
MDNIAAETDITLEHSTPVEKTIQENLNHYYNDLDRIEQRLVELDNEWDLERALQLTSASLTLAGVVLGIKQNKKWLLLSAAASGFLMNHSVLGWCPPLPVFKALGYRSRGEIDKEKFALKALRGDFDNPVHVPNAVWSAINK